MQYTVLFAEINLCRNQANPYDHTRIMSISSTAKLQPGLSASTAEERMSSKCKANDRRAHPERPVSKVTAPLSILTIFKLAQATALPTIRATTTLGCSTSTWPHAHTHIHLVVFAIVVSAVSVLIGPARLIVDA